MARLIMRRGPRPGQEYELTTDIVTIGSGTKNDIVILDNDVSREHCRLIKVVSDYELEDLKSFRGTFVSGQRVNSGWLLKPGSFIELGENVTLEYERSGDTSLSMPKVAAQAFKADGPDATMHPFLVMTVGLNPGQVYPLKTKSIKLGRDLTNDIVLQDPEVSRFHVVLNWTEKGFQLEDLHSTNGTRVNGVSLESGGTQLLRANDQIQLATMAEFRYTWHPQETTTEQGTKAVSSTGPTRILPKLDTSEVNLLGPKRNKPVTSRLGTGLQPGALTDHIFIAYAREEWETIVAPLTAILQDADFSVWVDQYLMQGGDDWMMAVEQALSECWMLIVVVSPAALESRYVKLAYRYFLNREKPIIPLLYAAVDSPPLELSSLKTIRYDKNNRKQSFEELLNLVRQRQR